jgi:hypothetical protein
VVNPEKNHISDNRFNEKIPFSPATGTATGMGIF